MSIKLGSINPGPLCFKHLETNCPICYQEMAPPHLKVQASVASGEGYMAFARGQANDSNPYPVNPNLTMWSVGWHKGERELVEKNLQITLERENLRKGQEHESVHLALEEVRGEIYSAKAKWPRRAASMHEQYAVILEELDELWDHVKVNQRKRDLTAARAEAKQVAAMAIRFMTEVCDEDYGRR